MHVIGIVAEYNPFHNGHAHMVRELRKKYPDTAILAVMSGSFTQRGSAAIMDKWSRARMALQGGCDLVVELPFVFAARSAQDFARGAVLLMNRLGIVSEMAFGTECRDPEKLWDAAALIDTPCIQDALHASIGTGQSYAHALAAELSARTGLSQSTLREPNTILAVEYLRSLHLTGSCIAPLPVRRRGAGHNDIGLYGNTASASGIRKKLLEHGPDWDALSRVLPETSMRLLREGGEFPKDERLYRPLLAILLTKSHGELQNIHGINEGLEYRILSMLPVSRSLHGFICAVSGKRYPKSRIRRILIHVLTGFQWSHGAAFDRIGPQYARILAFNDRGRLLLRRMKHIGSLPLITKTTHVLSSADLHREPRELTPLQEMLRFDCLATDLQALSYACPRVAGSDFLTSPAYLSEILQ